MRPLGNDAWQGTFTTIDIGRYYYTIRAREDPFETWKSSLVKKVSSDQDVTVDLSIGAELMADAANRAALDDAELLREWADTVLDSDVPVDSKLALVESREVIEVVRRHTDEHSYATYPRELGVVVDRERARFSSWYEMFPRSSRPKLGGEGTLEECEARLPYIAEMGFDVIYVPPVHPIGVTHRKGPNNSLDTSPGDPGSPWAIGSQDGGHKALNPKLGTLEDFRRFVAKSKEHGIELAIDIAFQCSPDHPYVNEHPEWFRWRPDGTVQYAENPPKKYEDILPFDFQSEDWPELWEELKSVVAFWIEQGVRIFRVDNPHTKPFPFWEWLIKGIKDLHPDVIFLSESFTRPNVMYRLAKLGFTQSYTYFAWRNTKREITQFFAELTLTDVAEYYRPNLWPNTPDILTEYLQHGGKTAFMVRLALAATLGSSYGIYGPAFELCENIPREPGSEEYLNSEKYEIRQWDLEQPGSLKEYIARVNRIRRENPALQSNRGLSFYPVDNEDIICYGRYTDDRANYLLVFVNLDPHHTQSGLVELPVADMGLPADEPYQVRDLLGGATFLWHGPRNYVELDPRVSPAYIFQVRRRVRREQDFEYYL